MTHTINQIHTIWKETRAGIGYRLDVVFFLSAVTLLNIHLLRQGFDTSWVFMPSEVGNGQWWRLLTHPFVHLSLYHLMLDAGAFFILYTGLREQSIGKKLVYVTACGISSLAAALLFSPEIYTKGLCGLSGIAHGLMAVSALEMIWEKDHQKAGVASFLMVTGKCAYEVWTGHAVFLFMHMGLCGTPLVACHAGGVTGGVIAFLCLRIKCSGMQDSLVERK